MKFDRPVYASRVKWRNVIVRVLHGGTQARNTKPDCCQKRCMSHFSEIVLLQDDFTILYMKFIGNI